jgi:hypothetical protein
LRQGLLPITLALALIAVGCAGTPATTPVTPADTPEARALESRLASAIAIGQTSSAISGAIEFPTSLRNLPNVEDGRPPVYLHAFKTTGELIREAQVAVFWKDDQTVAYVVDNVPANYPTVLAATVEPGIVMRAVIPPASPEKPALAQPINATTEMIVREMTAQGVMPPVALGGVGSVLAQGGVDPAGAAAEAEKAAVEMEAVANSDWGRDIPEAKQLAADLRTLAKTYQNLAAGGPRGYAVLADCGWNIFCHIGNLFTGNQKVQEKAKTSPPPANIQNNLNNYGNNLGNSLGKVVSAGGANVVSAGGANVVSAGGANVVSAGGANVVSAGGANVVSAGGANVVSAGGANVVSAGGANVVSAGGANLIGHAGGNMFIRTFQGPSSAVMNLADLYADGKALAQEKLGLTGPGGKAFTEAEIAQALAAGKGPYRQRCEDASFDGSRQNCTVVVNPMGTQEVLITRKATDFAQFIRDFQAAHIAGDVARAKALLNENVSAHNFVFDDQRWQSPVGTWRIRLVQDAGNSDLPRGYALLADSEVTIESPGKTPQDRIASGPFTGAITAWVPNQGSERLDTFAIRFNWSLEAKTLTSGLITGEERGVGAAQRVLRRANFDATLDASHTRISGQWAAEDKSTSGRFEMIRGTANFGL